MDIPESNKPWLKGMATFFKTGPLAVKVTKSDLGPFLFDMKNGFRVDPKRESEVSNKLKFNEPIEYTITISKYDQPEIYEVLSDHNTKDLSTDSLECLRIKSNRDLYSRSIYAEETDWKAGICVIKITITPQKHQYNEYSYSLATNTRFLLPEKDPMRHTTKIGRACDTFCDLGSEFISSGFLNLDIESSLRRGRNVVIDLGFYNPQFPGELELLSSGVLGLGSFPIGSIPLDKIRTMNLFDQLFPNGLQNTDDIEKIPTFLDSLRKTADFKTVISIKDRNKNPHLFLSFILKDRPKYIPEKPLEKIETNITFASCDELFSLLNFEFKVGILENDYNNEPFMTIESNSSGDLTIIHETLDEDLIKNILIPIINKSLDENKRVTLKRKNIANEIESDYISVYKDDNNTVIYISDLSDRDFLPFACELTPDLLERSEEVIIPFNSCDDDYEAGRLAIKEFLISHDIDTRVWFKGEKEIRVRRI